MYNINLYNNCFFYIYQQIPSKTYDNEKVNKDMPLVSDTTFNSSNALIIPTLLINLFFKLKFLFQKQILINLHQN